MPSRWARVRRSRFCSAAVALLAAVGFPTSRALRCPRPRGSRCEARGVPDSRRITSRSPWPCWAPGESWWSPREVRRGVQRHQLLATRCAVSPETDAASGGDPARRIDHLAYGARAGDDRDRRRRPRFRHAVDGRRGAPWLLFAVAAGGVYLPCPTPSSPRDARRRGALHLAECADTDSARSVHAAERGDGPDSSPGWWWWAGAAGPAPLSEGSPSSACSWPSPSGGGWSAGCPTMASTACAVTSRSGRPESGLVAHVVRGSRPRPSSSSPCTRAGVAAREDKALAALAHRRPDDRRRGRRGAGAVPASA